MSPFHLIVAAVATVPLWGFAIHEDFPWYYLISILAGELLLIFLSGFLAVIVTAPFAVFRNPKSCPKCRARLGFAGRHFDPLGSHKPHWTDIAIFLIFIGLNIKVWISIVRGEL